jgi:predicted ArsR family transcriptional regulator
MPHRTRQRIINILDQRGMATARELSRILNVTPANVRHHISVLIEQGSIKIAEIKESKFRGRPAAVYALTQSAFKDNLNLLSSILLKNLKELPPDIPQIERLQWLAEQLAAQYPQKPTNPTQQMYSAMQTLNRLNYHAQWEAHADSPRIMFGHCPYAAILDEHPEMCQVDEYLLKNLTGDPAELKSKRAIAPDGRRHCIFRIMKK